MQKLKIISVLLAIAVASGMTVCAGSNGSGIDTPAYSKSTSSAAADA